MHRILLAPRTVGKSLKVLCNLYRFGARYRTSPTTFLSERDLTEGLAVPRKENPRRPVLDDIRFAALLSVADRVRMATTDGGRRRSYLSPCLLSDGRRRDDRGRDAPRAARAGGALMREPADPETDPRRIRGDARTGAHAAE